MENEDIRIDDGSIVQIDEQNNESTEGNNESTELINHTEEGDHGMKEIFLFLLLFIHVSLPP